MILNLKDYENFETKLVDIRKENEHSNLQLKDKSLSLNSTTD